jgi:hypothetical protein
VLRQDVEIYDALKSRRLLFPQKRTLAECIGMSANGFMPKAIRRYRFAVRAFQAASESI